MMALDDEAALAEMDAFDRDLQDLEALYRANEDRLLEAYRHAFGEASLAYLTARRFFEDPPSVSPERLDRLVEAARQSLCGETRESFNEEVARFLVTRKALGAATDHLWERLRALRAELLAP